MLPIDIKSMLFHTAREVSALRRFLIVTVDADVDANSDASFFGVPPLPEGFDESEDMNQGRNRKGRFGRGASMKAARSRSASVSLDREREREGEVEESRGVRSVGAWSAGRPRLASDAGELWSGISSDARRRSPTRLPSSPTFFASSVSRTSAWMERRTAESVRCAGGRSDGCDTRLALGVASLTSGSPSASRSDLALLSLLLIARGAAATAPSLGR